MFSDFSSSNCDLQVRDTEPTKWVEWSGVARSLHVFFTLKLQSFIVLSHTCHEALKLPLRQNHNSVVL
jgi:hypothetical protein